MAKAYVLNKGGAWNPMMSYPRNSECPCGSGKKFKKCHLNNTTLAIDKSEEKKLRNFVNAVKENPDVSFKKDNS